MSRAIIKAVIDADANQYTLTIPNLGDVSGQLVTVDFMPVGTEITIVDLDNEPPSSNKQHGAIRFLPNTKLNYVYSVDEPNYNYRTTAVWKTSQELWNTDNKAQLAKAYILSSLRNPRWQKEYPLYKKGKVTEIIDEKYMRVDILGDMQRKCRTDYMTCDTLPFLIDDLVIVFYENGSWDKPVVIGFWDFPQPCIQPVDGSNNIFARIGPEITFDPPLGVISCIITNIEWFTDTWISRFNNTKYSFEFANWDGSGWAREESGLDVTYANINADSLPESDQANWLYTNQPSKARLTWTEIYNAEFIKRLFVTFTLDSIDYTLYGATTVLIESGDEIVLDWSSVP